MTSQRSEPTTRQEAISCLQAMRKFSDKMEPHIGETARKNAEALQMAIEALRREIERVESEREAVLGTSQLEQPADELA